MTESLVVNGHTVEVPVVEQTANTRRGSCPQLGDMANRPHPHIHT